MSEAQKMLQHAAVVTACGAAVADIVSIAAGQILMGVALLLLLVSRTPVRLPRVWPAIAVFIAGTLISDFVNGHARAGMPQIKKFYVFVILIVVYSAVRNLKEIRATWLLIAAAAVVNAVWAIQQYWEKVGEAEDLHRDFYSYYVVNRITGFQSHWMTFSGLEMMVVLAAAALLLWGGLDRRLQIALILACIVMLAGIVLSDTRGVWLAVIVAGCYLVGNWRPKLLAAVPVLLVGGFLVAPAAVQQRVKSIYRPHGTLDSNEHRRIVTVTGWEMIKAHPLLGVGPQRVGSEFMKYLPASVPRPLPSGYYEHLHSIYVHFAAERGVPTMLALIVMLVWALVNFIRGARDATGLRKAVLLGASAVIVGTMVEGFFELNLGDSEPLALFLAVVAFGYIALERAPEPLDA